MFDVKNKENETKINLEPKAGWKPMKKTIEEALTVATPSWPLQNTVAVNPFWFRRDQGFYDAIGELSEVIHRGLYMPIEYYLERYTNGDISHSALKSSLGRLSPRYSNLPKNVDELLLISRKEGVYRQKFQSASDFYDEALGRNIRISLNAEVARYAAAYMDNRQALSRFPWQHLDFLSAFCEASKYDSNLEILGFPSLSSVTRRISLQSAESVIADVFAEIQIQDPVCQRRILERAAFSVLGWMTQFKYVEWQKGLGYDVDSNANAADLLAVRLIYELAAYERLKAEHGDLADQWRAQALQHDENSRVHNEAQPMEIVWQSAFEESYQRRITDSLKTGPTINYAPESSVDAQIAFCIDVRSEMIRRHIEAKDKKIATVGFAGFFGVALDYKKIDEQDVGHRCPVLLTPALKVVESGKLGAGNAANLAVTRKLTFSYFKALRKAPLSSFVYVEMLGILALRPLLARTWRALKAQTTASRIPGRFATSKFAPDLGSCKDNHGSELTIEGRSERAAAVLRHMGLTSGFAPLVVIAGHGSHTTNNAFGSALDCGACGGHAGDINARILVGLLNDAAVRKGLLAHSISIPSTTRFIAAVHETVTDEVYLLDEELIPSQHQKAAQSLTRTLKQAALGARTERQTARSRFASDDAPKRARNWSEIRPEWGLAGNACFIVAPRSRTLGVNLGSRSFLHDYDFKKDDSYKTLELIMTAPMVVTNWINLQYFASTVAPDVYGAGNKTLHNVVNECGVVEGNGGDLRVGLPLQSVHDGSRFVHEPVRLSVFIEAPQEAIEDIIQKHQVVRELVDNEWLYLLRIDRDSGSVRVRRPNGIYESVR